jgi:hypothetical protein
MVMWTAPKIWNGGECFIIGGGSSMPRQFGIPESIIQDVMTWISRPSVYSEYLSQLHNKHVIGVNNAYQIGTWIDAVFFGDCHWYLVHRQALSKWPGIKVTCCYRFSGRSEKEMEGIKFLSRDKKRKHGISTSPSFVSWNGNSGAAAISLAVHFGVKRIILLGFDMNLDENQNSHWHGSHRNPNGREAIRKIKRKPPFERHLRGFPDIAEDARRMGVEILNANPNSAINDFKKVTVKDVLGNT